MDIAIVSGLRMNVSATVNGGHCVALRLDV